MILEIVAVVVPLAFLLVGCFVMGGIDRRRAASFEEFKQRYLDRKAQVEREARKRL